MIKNKKKNKKKTNYYQYEQQFWSKNQIVLGLDEAGRGSWAGPIVVAGCILPINYYNSQIKDSKQLTIKAREQLYDEITKVAISYQIKFIDAELVDKYNPKQATINGMTDIINAITPAAAIALIDTEKITKTDIDTLSIIKGDQKSINIAAASILAKVARDKYMTQMQKKYPNFNFSKHKGYGTLLHLKELKKYGPIKKFHRYSYQPIKQVLKNYL